jgi:hypothetical protein
LSKYQSHEAKCSVRNRQLQRILRNQKVNNHVHNCQPVVSVLKRMNPIDIILSYVFKILFDIILLYTFGSSKCCLSVRQVFPPVLGKHFSSLPLMPRAIKICYRVWINLAEDRNKWQTVVDEVMNIQRTKDKEFLVCLKDCWCFEDSCASLLLAVSYRAIWHSVYFPLTTRTLIPRYLTLSILPSYYSHSHTALSDTQYTSRNTSH